MTIKLVHMTLAALSISGFVLRGVWMLGDSPLLRSRATRVLPHVVDTALLASGVVMLWRLHLYPTHQPWLAAKLVAIVCYVALGVVALRGRSRRGVRAGAFVLALAVFAYVVAVAVTRDPLPFASVMS